MAVSFTLWSLPSPLSGHPTWLPLPLVSHWPVLHFATALLAPFSARAPPAPSRPPPTSSARPFLWAHICCPAHASGIAGDPLPAPPLQISPQLPCHSRGFQLAIMGPLPVPPTFLCFTEKRGPSASCCCHLSCISACRLLPALLLCLRSRSQSGLPHHHRLSWGLLPPRPRNSVFKFP